MDKDAVGTLLRSQSGQNLANELGIVVYKEISSKSGEINVALESIMKVLLEPKKALKKEQINRAQELDSGSNFLGFFNPATNDESSSASTIVFLLAIASAAVGAFVYW